MNRSAGFLVLAAGALVAGFFGLVLLPSQQPRPAAKSSSSALAPASSTDVVHLETGPSAAVASSGRARGAPVPSGPQALDEPALMAQLRELRARDPELSLELARDGNARFRDSPDAAERAWFVVRALSELGRHDEARAEGRLLVERYRGTRWAEDVHRHLFVNPPTHPSERGYGKVLEEDP